MAGENQFNANEKKLTQIGLQGELGGTQKLSRTWLKNCTLAPTPRDCFVIHNHHKKTSSDSSY